MELPEALSEERSPAQAEQVECWWESLTKTVQTEIAGLFDSRVDDPSLSKREDLSWQELPIRLVGRLVDTETARETRMFKQQLFEYIANHEEVLFYLEDRSYHICRIHPAARTVVKERHLPASFRCPLSNGDSCPMQRILKAACGSSIDIDLVPHRSSGRRPAGSIIPENRTLEVSDSSPPQLPRIDHGFAHQRSRFRFR